MDQMNIFQVVQLIKPFPEVGLEDICFPLVCHLKLVEVKVAMRGRPAEARATSGILPVFVNKVLLEHSSAHSLRSSHSCFHSTAARLGLLDQRLHGP